MTSLVYLSFHSFAFSLHMFSTPLILTSAFIFILLVGCNPNLRQNSTGWRAFAVSSVGWAWPGASGGQVAYGLLGSVHPGMGIWMRLMVASILHPFPRAAHLPPPRTAPVPARFSWCWSSPQMLDHTFITAPNQCKQLMLTLQMPWVAPLQFRTHRFAHMCSHKHMGYYILPSLLSLI